MDIAVGRGQTSRMRASTFGRLGVAFAIGVASVSFAGAARAQSASPAPRMKAIVYREFGSPDVLRLEEIAKPIPDDDQVLVRVRAASVNPLDWHFMEGSPYVARISGFGFLRPLETRLGFRSYRDRVFLYVETGTRSPRCS